MSSFILLLFLSVALHESRTSHLWCQHLYCYCFFLSLYMNQVPVICDVNTYTVTVSFCHSTRIRYQSSVMSTLIILLFLSVTLQESGTSLLWCHHLYCYCFFLSLYKNQVPVICDVITYNLTVSFCHSTVYQRSNSQVRHIPPKMSDKYPTNLRVNTL
jgi:Ni,Fe-hydrogenase I small subunit